MINDGEPYGGSDYTMKVDDIAITHLVRCKSNMNHEHSIPERRGSLSGLGSKRGGEATAWTASGIPLKGK